MIALGVLSDVITTKWKILPVEQTGAVKGYIVSKVIQLSSDEAAMKAHAALLKKLNLVLVQIVAQEWPAQWPNFISEIVGSSNANATLCENNMHILKLLSEEIFDYSNGKLTGARVRELKAQFHNDFGQVFRLCESVLLGAEKPELLLATLETLCKFLNWIPLGYVFVTPLIETLITKFLPVGIFQNLTLQCLSEIASTEAPELEFRDKFKAMLVAFVHQLQNILAPTTNFVMVYKAGSEEARQFLHHLSMFFTNFIRYHLNVAEEPGPSRTALITGLSYVLQLTTLPDPEIFKICVDIWNYLAGVIYHAEIGLEAPIMSMPLNLGGSGGGGAGGGGGFGGFGGGGRLGAGGQQRTEYSEILSQARRVLISRMPKPEEILIKEEDGHIVRETLQDTENTTLYHSMRSTLVFLTHLDPEDTERIMLDMLSRQVDDSEWSWSALSTLCWAIGSISGAFSEEAEKRFLVVVIKDLLYLTEKKRGKDNKAVVASNIMYIVGQYPRFLRAHWRFLRTVVYKLFEFMHEKHPGVQDMAVDTFIKIADKCRRKFVQVQLGENVPFIEDMLRQLPDIISDLEQSQIHEFYEGAGFMIRAVTDSTVRDQYLMKLMELPNESWTETMARAGANVQVLADPETCKTIVNILKTNIRVATSLESGYISQLGRIYLDMLNVYKATSQFVSMSVEAQGPRVVDHFNIRTMLSVKRSVLRLISSAIEKAEDLEMVARQFIPPLLEPVLSDYAANHPNAREAEVLALMATVISRLKQHVIGEVPRILAAVFECTLEMITKDFVNFPDHRINFFKLLSSIMSTCFSCLYALNEATFSLIIDSIVWAFKHDERNVSHTGLEILLELLSQMEAPPNVYATGGGGPGGMGMSGPSLADVENHNRLASIFYNRFLINIVQDVFAILTDTLHKPGLKLQARILMLICRGIVMGKIVITTDPSGQPLAARLNGPFASAAVASGLGIPQTVQAVTVIWVKDFIYSMLSQSFPHMNQSDLIKFINGLFDARLDQDAFKDLIKDFLIQLKEFSTKNYIDDEDIIALQNVAPVSGASGAAASVLGVGSNISVLNQIPGMVAPHQREDWQQHIDNNMDASNLADPNRFGQ